MGNEPTVREIGKLVEGVWLPKGEEHLTHWMTLGKKAFRKDGKITYQWGKQETAMKIADQFRPEWRSKYFLDVGAHVGLWSMWWGPVTMGVFAFEPIPAMRALYRANMDGRSTYSLSSYAISDIESEIELSFDPTNTGNTHTKTAFDKGLKTIKVTTTTLDEVMKPYPPIGVIKVDTEGVEERVVRGGLTLIRDQKPVMIVEQKKGAEYYGASPTGAIDLLIHEGYRTIKELSGDYIMVHEDFL